MGYLSPFLLKRVAKVRSWTGFQFTVQKRPVSGSGKGLVKRASLPKQPPLGSGNEAHLHGKTSAGGTVSTHSNESRWKGGNGDWCS